MHRLAYSFIVIFLVLGNDQLLSQTDTTVVDSISIMEEEDTPGFGSLFTGPPGKALLYSMVLPGAGQAYNRRYWKMPIVYAGIGTAVYILIDNKNEFDRFDSAFRQRVDDGADSEDEFQGILSLDRINNFREKWRKDVQRAYIGLGLVYLIQGLEAFVDRHLMDFNIDDDISLKVEYRLTPNGLGLVCNLQRRDPLAEARDFSFLH